MSEKGSELNHIVKTEIFYQRKKTKNKPAENFFFLMLFVSDLKKNY